MKDLHILICVSRLGIGGIQTFVLSLIQYFIKNYENLKIDLYVHYSDFVEDPNFDKISDKFRIYTLTKNKFLLKVINRVSSLLNLCGINLKQSLSERYFIRLVRKNKYDVIHSNIYITDQLALIAKSKYGIPFVTTPHGSYDGTKLSISKLSLMKSLNNYCDKYIYLSEKNLDNFKRYRLNNLKTQFIVNGYTNSLNRKQINDTFGCVKFCMVARGDEDKGWKILSNAVKLLKGQGFDFELHLAANGNLVKELFGGRESENIYYYGFLSNPTSIVAKCNVGLLPTYHEAESMPFSIIEYLYHGLPVIATNIGAVDYMINDANQKAGDLLPLSDNGKVHHEKLAMVMSKYLTSKEYIIEKSNVAKKAFAKFDIAKCANEYFKIYGELSQ